MASEVYEGFFYILYGVKMLRLKGRFPYTDLYLEWKKRDFSLRGTIDAPLEA